MNNMKVGEVRNGYRCVKSSVACKGCGFYKPPNCLKDENTFGACYTHLREDHNYVIFEEVANEKHGSW